MRKMILGFSFILLTSLGIQAQSAEYLRIFKSSSYNELSLKMADEVQLEIGRTKENLSKKAAIARLKDRLNRFKPTSWEMMHSGESELRDANYYILKASNDSDEGLRIFIHTSEKGSKRYITAIRFRRAL